MPMTVVVTTSVPLRFRGFLASCMLELAPGVYSHPRMSSGVRERVWTVLSDWWGEGCVNSSILMLWQDTSQSGGQGVLSLGMPSRTLFEHEGVLLSKQKS